MGRFARPAGNAEHCQLASTLSLSATAREPKACDVRRRELALAQLDPESACEIADVIAAGSVHASLMGAASTEASRGVGFERDDVTTGDLRAKMSRIAARADVL